MGKVLFVLPSLRGGGGEIMVYYLARAMRGLGWESLTLYGQAEHTLADRFAQARLPFQYLPKQWGRWLYTRLLLRTARQYRPTLIHCHTRDLWLPSAIVARSLQIPCLYNQHSAASWSGRRKRARYGKAIALTDAVVGVCAAICEELSAYFPQARAKIHFIPNGVPEPEPLPSLLLPQLPSGASLIGMAGYLAPPKDPLTLLEAFRRLAGEYPDLHLAFAGASSLSRHAQKDSYIPMLRERVRRAHLEGRVHLLGWQESLVHFLSRITIFVLSSYSEGMPLSILESMAARKPVVAAAVGGIPEVLGANEYGWLFPPGDADALTESLRSVLRDSEEVQSRVDRARQRYEAEYTDTRMAQRYTSLYEELILSP